MAKKRLVIFDLDGTLAESKAPLDSEMAGLLRRLLGVVRVAVISGGGWPQFEKQLLSNLPPDAPLVKLSLLPTCGTKFLEYREGWRELYSEDFTAEEKRRIMSALDEALRVTGLKSDLTWGEAIEDRSSQITFSALGQQAPNDAKSVWDPDSVKRKRIKAVLDTLLPGFSILIGGSTSIDVTKQGIDKAHGIRKLHEVLEIGVSEMLFVGDALFVGGNDYPVKAAGVTSIAVRGPHETKPVVEAIIACLGE